MDLQSTNGEGSRRGLTRWTGIALDIVFPRNCPLCNRSLREEDEGCICPVCYASFKRIEPPMCHWCGRPVHGEILNEFVCTQCVGRTLLYDRAVSVVMADRLMLDAIHRFKYQREEYFGPQMGTLLCEGAARYVDWSRIDAIVPVPLHPRKERHRMFNQARVLCGSLGQQFDRPIHDRNLRRRIDTPSQTFLNAEERRKNLRDAFAVERPDEFKGKRLVLVDDVYTTGSTTNVCAQELKRAGATHVFVLTLARAY